MKEPTYIRKGATFSGCFKYRYGLTRVWDESLPTVAFIMLNPSTADDDQLDPTLRRCLGFARTLGYGAMEIGNLFALKSTDPEALYSSEDPIGPLNDNMLKSTSWKTPKP